MNVENLIKLKYNYTRLYLKDKIEMSSQKQVGKTQQLKTVKLNVR